jgi:hypothetical protein
MINEFSSSLTIVTLIVLVLLLVGVALESVRFLTAVAGAALRGAVRALGAVLLVVTICALLVVVLIR